MRALVLGGAGIRQIFTIYSHLATNSHGAGTAGAFVGKRQKLGVRIAGRCAFGHKAKGHLGGRAEQPLDPPRI
jgi:hypothetical protein